MQTIIDSLIVKLGLDSSGFDSQRGKVDKSLKETGKTADNTAQSVMRFMAVLGGTAVVKRFVESQIESNAALLRFSRAVDESVGRVSAFSQAAELAGGSAEGLQGALDMLSHAQTELQLTGQSSLIPYLSALGVGMTDAFGKAKPVSDLLIDIGQGLLTRNQGDYKAAFNMGRMMGIDQGTLALILKGRSEVELTIKRQAEQTAVTKKQAEEATRMQRAMRENAQAAQAFGRSLLESATPALEKVLALVGQDVQWMRDNKEFVESFLTVLAVGFAAVAASMIKISPAVVILTSLAGAIALLKDDYDNWKRGGDSLVDWAKWAPGINMALHGIRLLRDALYDLSYRAIGLASFDYSLLHGDVEGMKRGAQAMVEGSGIKLGQGTSGLPEVQLIQTAPDVATSGANDISARKRFIAIAASELGVNPGAIDAQLRLETGAVGGKTVGAYNYGNVKAGAKWVGATASANTTEYDASGAHSENAAFRAYGSPEEAARDYAALIRSRYASAVGAKSAEEYANALKLGGYATDPAYVSKIARIAQGIPGASQAAIGGGASAAGPVSNSKTVETHIGQITVNTSATDAAGIGRDIAQSKDFLFVSQANSGMN